MNSPASAQLRSGGYLWGPERVRLGISLDKLARRSGVAKGMLSLYENGRMVPSSGEFDRVMAVLREAAQGTTRP